MTQSHEKGRLLIYYLLVSGLTSLVLMVAAAASLLVIQPERSLMIVLILLILYKAVLVGFGAWVVHQQSKYDRVYITRFTGSYLARFYGILLGFFLGAEIAGWMGAIAGAVLLYIAGRWAGSRLSESIGAGLAGRFVLEKLEVQPSIEEKVSKRWRWVILAALYPALVVLAVVMMSNFGMQDYGIPQEWLPIARIIIIVLTIFEVSAPWFFQKVAEKSHQECQINLFRFGLAASLTPAVFGFFLFVCGGTTFEVIVLGLISSGSAMFWGSKFIQKGL